MATSPVLTNNLTDFTYIYGGTNRTVSAENILPIGGVADVDSPTTPLIAGNAHPITFVIIFTTGFNQTQQLYITGSYGHPYHL